MRQRPVRVALAHPDDGAHHMSRRFARGMPRSPRLLFQPQGPTADIPIDPLVAGFARDAALGTQFSDRAGAAQMVGDEQSPLVHR